MEVTFRLNDNDYRDFVKHVYAQAEAHGNIRAKLSVHALVCRTCPVVAAIATYYFWLENPSASLEYWYLTLLSIICWFMTWYWYLKRYHNLQIMHLNPSDGYFMQEQCLTVSKSGLSVVRSTLSENYQWSALKAVQHSDRMFFLHLDTVHAICVPQRAFSSTTEAEQLTIDTADRTHTKSFDQSHQPYTVPSLSHGQLQESSISSFSSSSIPMISLSKFFPI
jgi:YcxB-like protein